MALRTQCDRRWAEQQVRQEAALCAQRWGTTQAAHILELSPRTLRHWRKRRREDRLTPAVRGRSPVECPVPVRNEVIQFLHRVTGPSVGLPALRCLFPEIRRCVLEDLLVRYRRIWRRRYMQRGFRLAWHHAGAVWAMDHSEPLQPVDGVSPYLFVVRDLASRRQLAWHPVQTVTAEETLPILLLTAAQPMGPGDQRELGNQ